mgnify:CR=1 FL=1|jgi:hypothetical protein
MVDRMQAKEGNNIPELACAENAMPSPNSALEWAAPITGGPSIGPKVEA